MAEPHDSRLPDDPYLSVIAASRNDEHGGNLLGRTQIFVEAWINQAKRHNISSELILVEWNPPKDRERLAKALRWPADTGPCRVRIIEVPPEIHQRYKHGDNLPLYQMIGKNAGIRRSRGEFLILTNIDIVFSDELCRFLAARRLEKGKMYRIDRTDVAEDVPVNGTLDQQLDYCRSHVIRLYSREEAYPVTPDGFRQVGSPDIIRPDSGLHLGVGWFPVEGAQGTTPYRWMGNEAEILAEIPTGGALLQLQVEPGPGAGLDPGPKTLEVVDWNGATVASCSVTGRSTLHLVIPAPPAEGIRSIRLRAPDGGTPLPADHRILNFRIFRCELGGFATWLVPGTTRIQAIRRARPTLLRLIQSARSSDGPLSVVRPAARLLRRRGGDIFEFGMQCRLGQGWYGIEEPELEKYRWVMQDAQLTTRVGPNRSLSILLEPGPSLGFQPFELVVRAADGPILARIPVNGLTYAEFPTPLPAGSIVPLILSAEGGGAPLGNDPRTLNFRVYAVGQGTERSDAPPVHDPKKWIALTVETVPAETDWSITLAPQRKKIEQMGKPAFLHTYACGDFTMMARQHWFDLRGYIEFDGYSMHMDSMLCYAAHHGGAPEELLPAPMRVYHVEHGIGSGWSPEGQNHLFSRLSSKGISWVSNDDMSDLITQMRSSDSPVIFNPETWGLANDMLPEIDPVAVEPGLVASKV